MLNIHNIMEELVIGRVNALYDQAIQMKAPWLTCDCEQCRLDTTCYVLNKLAPKYVISGRGLIHITKDSDRQLLADIDSLTIEAMRIVSSIHRPYHGSSSAEINNQEENKPVFNFPTFIGTIYDGVSFEPLINAKVILKLNGNIATMIDYSWVNPYITAKLTKATYSFWVKPEIAEKEKISKVFTFSVEVTADGYDSVTHNFDVPVISDIKPNHSVNTTYSLKLPDILLFSKTIENTMDMNP